MQFMHHMLLAATADFKSLRRSNILALIMLTLLVGCSTLVVGPFAAEPTVARLMSVKPVTARLPAAGLGLTSTCISGQSASASYSVKVCISNPSSGATLTGDHAVTATVSLSSGAPGVQRVMFYLDGGYILTDYQSLYTFTLRTSKWVDGSHSISANALLRDGFTTQRAAISVIFKNGITIVPGNTSQFHPTSGRSAESGTAFIVAAAGDGASGETNAANVSNLIVGRNPNLFLYLGDTYERGSVPEFFNWYGTSSTYFGRLRSITDPTVGNHEYLTTGAHGYFDYWNNIPNYYSFNAHSWHFISLNSNNTYAPTGTSSAQYQWLQKDLAGVPSSICTIAYYHHPLFNIGSQASATYMSAIWQLMTKYHVDIVLNGHDHDYQRWLPLDGNGNQSATGIVEFVVGSGGHGLQQFTRTDSRVAYSNAANPGAFGALFLQLNSQSADFMYRNTSGTVLDSGVIPCKP